MHGVVATFIIVALLTFVQNMSFTLVSRSRNRENKTYHVCASVFSNGIWYVTIGLLSRYSFKGWLAIPYIIGAVLGSVFGMTVGIWVEKRFGLASDTHLKPVAIIKNEKS